MQRLKWGLGMTPDDLDLSNREVEMNGPKPPHWLGKLARLAMRAFRSDGEIAPVGCHFHKNDERETTQWEVTLFVSSTEVFGGSLDGQRSFSPFMVDLTELMLSLDVIESCYWQAQAMAEDDQLGPHVGIEGQFQGHSVWLRITAQPPEQFDSGRAFDQFAGERLDLW